MKNLTLKRKLTVLCLFVLLIVSLFGIIATNRSPNKVVNAESPDYRLLFEYKDYHYNDGNKKYGSADTLITESVANEITYGSPSKTFYISAYNKSLTSKIESLGNIAYFNFNSIYIDISDYMADAINIYLSNSSGEIFDNFSKETYYFTSGEFNNLKDDKYTLFYMFDYHIKTTHGFANSYQYYGRLEITSSFYIDTTAPEILFNIDDDLDEGYYNPTNIFYSSSQVKVDLLDATSGIKNAYYSVSKTKNFPYSATTTLQSGTTFTEEGNYTVVVTDKAGNTTTKHFTIDKTAPSLEIPSNFIKNNSQGNLFFTNKDFVATWDNFANSNDLKGNLSNDSDILRVLYSYSENSFIEKLTPYQSEPITKEGLYLFSIIDLSGNSTKYRIILDKTAPVLNLSVNNFTNSTVTWEVEKDVGIGLNFTHVHDIISIKYKNETATPYFPSSPEILAGSGAHYSTLKGSFQAVGNYIVVCSDYAGNKTEYNFTIDKTAPILKIPTANNIKNDIYYYSNQIKIDWDNSIKGVYEQRSNSNDSLTVTYSYSENPLVFPTQATEPYTKDTNITTEGAYLFTITDKAGNTTNYKIILDKTAPTITLSGVEPNGFTNTNVTFSSNPLETIQVAHLISTGSSYYSNTHTKENGNLYEGKIFTAEGHYTLAVYDLAYNYTYYNFTIDKTAPSLAVYSEKGISVPNNESIRTKENIYATWDITKNNITIKTNLCHENDNLKAYYIFNKTNTLEYSRNTNLTETGSYQIKLVDRAGNITYSDLWEIYRTPPSFKVYSESGSEKISEYFAYNEKFLVKWDNDLWLATLNGEPYTKGTVVEVDGEYKFILTDELGNENKQTLFLITSLPTKNFNSLKSTNNRWYETTNTEGKTYSFNSYENALNFSISREEKLYTQSVYDGSVQVAPEDIELAKIGSNCYIYKSLAIASTNNAYFNIATLNNAINKYAQASVNEKYIPNTPATPYDKEVIYRDIYYTKNAIYFSKIQNCLLFIDGVEQQYPYTLTSAGEHEILEKDIAGNSISYTVYIDTELPIIKITNLEGNLPSTLKYGSSSYFTYGIIITLNDADKQALLKVNDTYYVGKQATLRESGTYNLTVRDVAGNVGSCTIYISLDEPTIEFEILEVGDIMNGFKVKIKKNLDLNTFNYFNVYRFNTDTEIWEQLTQDNSSPSSVLINKNNKEYTFTVSGEYQFILSDIFGRYIEQKYSFTKSAPVGNFHNHLNIIFPNYSHQNQNVMFSWNKNLDCSAEITLLGGTPIKYNNGSIIYDEGVYRIKLYSNVDAVFSIYEITIDKTAPTGELIISPKDEPNAILPTNSTTRHPVSLNWTETGCTATLNGEPYFTGATIKEEGEYTIILKDRAGNEAYYSFKIDTTAPTITALSNGKELKSGEYTRKDVLISWSESKCSCVLNTTPISSGYRVALEGTYTATLTDRYGNIANLTFTIDKTAPTGEIYINDKLYTGEKTKTIKTNGTSYISWSETGCTASLNNTYVYNQNDLLSDNGFYSIILTDIAGNKIQYDIEIKNKPPKASLLANGQEVYLYTEKQTLYTGEIINQNVRFTWTETGCTATCNETPYSNGATIKEEGEYTFVLLDAFGNSVVYKIIIDKTAPVLFAIYGNKDISNKEIINSKALVYWEEQGASATLNGAEFINGTLLKEEGEYTFVLTDTAGNKTNLTFIIDLSASTGTIISNNKVIDNGTKTRFKSYFTWNETGCTATLNGEPYTKRTIISSEGEYFISLIDKAGNKTEYNFTIDKTAPTGEILITKEVINNITSGNVSFVWEEQGASATLNGEPYTKGTVIEVDGEYTIILFDEAGNEVSYFIKVDKTAPSLLAKTTQNVLLNNNTLTLSDIYFTWNETGCTATLNGEPYEKETKISETGSYVLVLTDSVGNSTSMTITIDKTKPLVDFNYNNTDKFPYLNNGWSAFWDNSSYTATLNGELYNANTEIIAEGKYVLIVSNSLGATTSYEIIVDRTAPTGEFYNLNNELFVTEYSIKNFYFTWEEQGASATLNGDNYLKKSTISKEGSYRFLLVDEAGNYRVYEMFLTKEKPVIMFFSQTTNTEVSNRAYVSDNVIVVKENENDVLMLEGEEFTGEEPLAVGEYTFVITNEYGISNTFRITIRKDAQPIEMGRKTNISGLFRGSSTGTVIFATTFALIFFFSVSIPLFKGIFKRNPLKKRLK